MQRPTSYKDWRQLWHSVGKELGWHVFYRWQKQQPLMNRRSWMLLCRLKRISDRLEVENKVMDSSWCEAMLESICKP